MKKILLATLILFTMTIPTISSAMTPQTVTMTWTIADTSTVLGYKMYYSYSSDMTDRMLAWETSDPAATSLTCDIVDITFYPVYFTISTVSTIGEFDSEIKSANSSLSKVQNFIISF